MHKREYWNYAPTEQVDAMVNLCRNRSIVDFGAGAGSLCKFLVANGTANALGVDPQLQYLRKPEGPISWLPRYFADIDKTYFLGYDVAIISWPINHLDANIALVSLLETFDTVIYLGLNDGCTACGATPLWLYLTTRFELELAMVDCNQSQLLVYKRGIRTKPLLDCEKIGIELDASLLR